MALLKSLLIVLLAVVAFWFIASMFGLEISLFWTLVLSIVLTLALGLIARPGVPRRH